MSTPENKIDVGGLNIKEWSLLILVGGLVFTFVIVGLAFAMAISNPESELVLTGALDISQFVAVILGIAMVATVLVSQQLTQKAIAAATAQSDKAWSENP
ncbi:MAG: hypothetical protein ACW99F_17175 [Candidatus Hodarchaeales archaeon]|jgi:hypothetical protein